MRDEDKSKEQLIKELKDLRRQVRKEPSRNYPLFAPISETGPPGAGGTEQDRIRVAGINVEWDSRHGTCTFESLPVAMMWVDTTLAGLMSGVQAMVGTPRFLLALQSEGRKSVEADWEVISQFPDFFQGFKAIANIAAVAGWGAWELTSLDEEKKECRFRGADSWEGLYQKALGVCWGSGMLAGKMAGYCSKLFGTNCWADQTGFIAAGDAYDEFVVRPSSRSLEQEIDNLLAADEATRADMAVALGKLEKEIAERQRAEEALREAHQRLQAIIHASPLSIFVLDPDGKVLLWNPASEKTFGWREAEVVGRVLPIVPPDKEDEFRDNLRRALAGESLRGVELRRCRQDGTPVDISVYSSTLHNAQGQVTGVMVVDADITERKRAEEALQENEKKYRSLSQEFQAILDAIPDPICLLSPELLIGWANEAMAVGIDRSTIPEIIGQYCYALRHNRSQPCEDCAVIRCVRSGKVETKEVNLHGKIWELRGIPLYNEGHEFYGALEVARDLTERKQAKDELEKSISLLQATLESTADGLLVIDLAGKIVAYNQKFAEMWRIPEEVLISRDDDQALAFVLEQLADPEAFLSKVRELYSQPEAESYDLLEFKDGRFFERYSQPQRLGQTIVGRVWSFRDVTQRKQAEEALRQSEEKYRLLVNQIPAVVFEGYRDWGVDFWDEKVETLTGYSKEDFDSRRKKWDDVVLPEDLDYATKIFIEALKTDGSFVREHRIRRKDGEIRWIQCRGQIIFDAKGKIDHISGVTFDITPRKQAEEALSRSEEKYRLLVNQIPAVVFKGHPDWSVDFFDHKIEALTGYKKKDFDSRRKKWSEVILEEDFQEVRRKSREAVNTGSRSYERAYRIRKKDGGIAWIQAMGQIFYDAAGKLEYISGVFFDITERKRAEEALLKYEFIANAAEDCMTLIDHNYVYEAANAAYCQAQGKTLEEVLGTSVASIWGEDTFKKVIKGYLDQCFNGEAVEFEGWFEFGKQGLGCYHVFYNPYFDAQGKIIYAAVVSHDITERKRVEDALRQSEVKYRQLVDQIPAVVYRGYVDWSLECFDRKIEEITGYSMEEFNSRRKTWRDLIFPEDIQKAKQLLREALNIDGSYVTEHRIRKKTGEARWIQARNRIIRDAEGKIDYISGVFFDITERKELEDQLVKAQRMEAIGILAGGLAHDFNNLLTAIMGYSEIMMMDLRKEDPFHLFVEEITKAANRGASLTNQLLAFSRKQILQPRVINLNEVVVDMEKMLRRLIGEDIDLLTAIDQELGSVKGDPGQIEQIIMNLAVNARDAMPDGGKLTIETANIFLDEAYARSHVGVTPGPYAMLAVSDNGLGMDAETMSRIFEPFYTTKESGKGTGLGLATVYGIVKQSEGHIWVYSEPGLGTTFKIYLPRVEKGKEDIRIKIAPVTTLEGTETILLVEDDAALRELISTALRRYGFTALEAAHGGEALLICESHKAPIHLLLTDVVMPQISGTALAERLRQLQPEMKVLYMSGYTENAIVHHGVLDSKFNFIPKPFRVVALIQKVKEVLDSPKDA